MAKKKTAKTLKIKEKLHEAKIVNEHKWVGFTRKPLYLVYLIVGLIFISYHIYFADKVIPGVSVQGIDIGGMDSSRAVSTLRNNLIATGEAKLKINGNDFAIKTGDINFEYLPVETAKKAFNVGRKNGIEDSITNKIKGLFTSINIDPEYKYDREALDSRIAVMQRDMLDPVVEPHFSMVNGELNIIQGKSGDYLDVDQLKSEIEETIAFKKSATITPNITKQDPELTLEELDEILPEMDKIVNAGYKLTFENREWTITPEEIIAIVKPQKQDGKVVLRVDDRVLADKVNAIAAQIDRSPRAQTLEVDSGKVVKFLASEPGLKLKVKETSGLIKQSMLNASPNIELAVQVTVPPETDNEYGIKELIAEGTSKFKGSAAGRVHNIELAASRVNGILVPPGEVFSFNKAVGEVSRATGYATAYVISSGRTVLGDGGGLCQVSTTVFRAALNAGLPMVERHAHSYRVSYYEQDSAPGIDATVYVPSVDLKFRNDTNHYILIVSEFNKEESSLSYKIYGTKDGRTVEVSEPKVLSRTPPPANVYEDDPSMAKGTTVQVEHPVWGASVVFNRVVKKGGEILSNDTFKSNYRAWAAVYKVGTRD